MSVQFSSQKPGVGIRDQNRWKSLSGINDGACHLDAFSGHVKADEQRTKEKRQLSETGKWRIQAKRRGNKEPRGPGGRTAGSREATCPIFHSHEVQLCCLQLDSEWFLYVLPISSFFLLFTMKYTIHMKHSMKSRHRAKNVNINTVYSLSRLIISTLEVPCIMPLPNHTSSYSEFWVNYSLVISYINYYCIKTSF